MIKKAFVFIFFLIIIVPNLGFFLTLDKTKLNERRQLATRDSIAYHNFKEFTITFDNFVSDNFEFRKLLLSTNSSLRYKIFNTTLNDKVIIGKDEWLFLNKLGGDNAFADFTHRNLLSNQELYTIKNTLYKRKSILDRKGITYYPIIYPNPHTIYSSQLPQNVLKSVIGQTSRCQQLMQYVNDPHKIEILNPTSELIAEKDNYLLYLKNDTHWNEMGAYFAYKFLFNKIAEDLPVLKPKTLNEFDVYWIRSLDDPILTELGERNDVFKDYKFKGQANVYCPNGLENLLGISQRKAIRDSVPILIDKSGFHAKKTVEQGKRKTARDLVVYRNPKQKNGLTAIVYRDSYTDAIQKFLIPHFSKIILTRAHFNLTQIEKHKADVVIEGRVERYFPAHFKF